MLSLTFPFRLNALPAAPFVHHSLGAAPAAALPAMVAAPVEAPLVSPYGEPPPDLDQRVRETGEW